MDGKQPRIWPAPEPGTVYGQLRIDLHGIDKGYFFAATAKQTKSRLKLRVQKQGGTMLTYDLNGDKRPELFSLQLGDGRYVVTLYRNVTRKLYGKIGAVSFDVELDNVDAPFLIPNQYVNYSEDSTVVRIADRMCMGQPDIDVYDTVCDFVTRSFGYDFIKAITVKPGMLPDIDSVFARNMGVCQDLAALTVAMLRSQGIPSMLVIGYADKQYHAWTLSRVDGREYLFDPTEEISAINKVKKYTTERIY